MKDSHLRDFIAVLESGSIRAAARRLGITQAAVSKNLQALERSVGLQLLRRSAHGVEPTDPGRILFRRARIAAGELRKAEEEMAESAGTASGTVRLGISPIAEALLMPVAFARFRKLYPQALIRISEGTTVTTIAALREGRLDFAIGTAGNQQLSGDLDTERLVSADLVVVARAGHPMVHRTALQDLAGCEWVAGGPPGTSDTEVVRAFSAAGLPAPDMPVQRDSLSALLFLLANSDFLAITSRQAVQLFCSSNLLGVLPVDLNLPVLPHNLITVRDRPLSTMAHALATEFRRAARGHRR